MSALRLVQPLACQEVVERVATTDAQATAHLVLDVALKDAARALRSPVGTPAYRRARAELLLERAGHSAARMLGEHRRAER